MRFICILSILGLLLCSAIELIGGNTPYLVTIEGILIFMSGGSVVILAFSEVDAIDKFKKQYPQYSIKSVEKK